MRNNAKIAFIGSGAMGEAMIKGLLAKEIATAEQITASDISEQRLATMAETYGIHTTTDNAAAVRDASVVVLSIKPQVLDVVAEGLHGTIPADALVISIVAGATIATLQAGVGHKRIVRTIPNTPAQINMGMTVWTATSAVSSEQRVQAESILRALGEQVFVEKETYIDMATGLSGSGPAYVFLIIEAMIDAGVRMGFYRADAEKMVLQTLAGSVELVRTTGSHPTALRNLVTSPGGTTAAGLYELERSGLRTALADAIDAAYRRSRELGGRS